MADVIVQSFTGHGHEFTALSKDKDGKKTGSGNKYVLPPKSAAKNIMIVPEEDFKHIEKSAIYQSLLNTKRIRVLENIPNRYKSSSEEIATARQAVKDAHAKVDAKDAEIARLNALLAEKDKALEDMGGAKEPKKRKDKVEE